MAYEKIAVTGGCGLLGNHIVTLLSNHATVTSIDVKELASNELSSIKYVNASVTNFDQMKNALRGNDALIHLAAIPNPREASLELTFNTNVQGAWTVFQAAEEVGIKRVVIASSDSVFGFSYNPPDWKPRFLPVDETHLTRPTEVYSLSKKVTETIAESFAARYNMEVISIRPCHIIFPRGYGEIKKRGQDINNYHFWAWVDPEDVAQAFQLAINSSNYNGYEVYTVAAEDGLNEAPTLEIAQKRWGNNLEIRRPDIFKSNQFASILDTTKIKEHLGYKPKISLEKLKSKAKAFKT